MGWLFSVFVQKTSNKLTSKQGQDGSMVLLIADTLSIGAKINDLG